MRRNRIIAAGALVIAAGALGTNTAAQSTSTTFGAIYDKLNEILAVVEGFGVDLSGVQPNWDKTLPANDPGGPCPSSSSRFTCVFDGEAVRDNETGLVWEQSPSTVRYRWNPGTASDGSSFTSAREHCAFTATGGHRGWRLPSLDELTSLQDATQPAGQSDLPPGHPFMAGVENSGYWTATTTAENNNTAWTVGFLGGGGFYDGKEVLARTWCVRGGSGMGERY